MYTLGHLIIVGIIFFIFGSLVTMKVCKAITRWIAKNDEEYADMTLQEIVDEYDGIVNEDKKD